MSAPITVVWAVVPLTVLAYLGSFYESKVNFRTCVAPDINTLSLFEEAMLLGSSPNRLGIAVCVILTVPSAELRI